VVYPFYRITHAVLLVGILTIYLDAPPGCREQCQQPHPLLEDLVERVRHPSRDNFSLRIEEWGGKLANIDEKTEDSVNVTETPD